MSIEERLHQAILGLRQSIIKLGEEYNNISNMSDSNAKLETERINDVETNLRNLVFSLNCPQLNSKLSLIISSKERQGFNIEREVNFNKLVYYIEHLNSMKHPKRALKKNPNYCVTVLNTIAEEYLLIKKYIAKTIQSNLSKNKEKAGDSYDKYRKKIADQWNVFCSQSIKDLVNEKTNLVVSQIENSI